MPERLGHEGSTLYDIGVKMASKANTSKATKEVKADAKSVSAIRSAVGKAENLERALVVTLSGRLKAGVSVREMKASIVEGTKEGALAYIKPSSAQYLPTIAELLNLADSASFTIGQLYGLASDLHAASAKVSGKRAPEVVKEAIRKACDEGKSAEEIRKATPRKDAESKSRKPRPNSLAVDTLNPAEMAEQVTALANALRNYSEKEGTVSEALKYALDELAMNLSAFGI